MHADTIKSMNALASSFYEAGDYEKAEPLYRQALASGRASLGETHVVTLTSMNNLVSGHPHLECCCTCCHGSCLLPPPRHPHTTEHHRG